MAGLPCAVQVVGAGRRLVEEEVLGFMGVTEEALRNDGVFYQHLNIEEYMGSDGKSAPVVVEPTEKKGVGADKEIGGEHEKEIIQHELEMLGGSS